MRSGTCYLRCFDFVYSVCNSIYIARKKAETKTEIEKGRDRSASLKVSDAVFATLHTMPAFFLSFDKISFTHEGPIYFCMINVMINERNYLSDLFIYLLWLTLLCVYNHRYYIIINSFVRAYKNTFLLGNHREQRTAMEKLILIRILQCVHNM